MLSPTADPAPTLTDRLALRVLQAGALASVLAVVPYFAFELDRFYVPKEFVLHATACLTALLTLRHAGRMQVTRVDKWLGLFFVAGIVSALLAPNGWNAARTLALTASGLAVFWSARSLRAAGLATPLVGALVLAVVVAALTALLQAYGLRTDFFSTNRAPGGTLGNRNAIGHIVALGFPLVVLMALETRRPSRFGLSALSALLCIAALVLTRSRAAWLGLGIVLMVLLVGLLVVAFRHHAWRVPVRFGLLVGAMALGAGVALLLPNTLRWNSDTPYLETVRGVTNYRDGSGQGRLIQYRRSLAMTLHHPVFGVGPGNWPVVYPEFAARRDPSMSGRHAGRTANPWPSSDAVAVTAERGLLGLIPLGLALLLLVARSLRVVWSATTREEAMRACVLLAVLAGAFTCGLFDAVLLLAWPMLIVAAAAGMLWPSADPPVTTPVDSPAAVPAPHPHAWRAGLMLALMGVACGGGAMLSAQQLAAMSIFSHAQNRTDLERAARLDPGNYRIRLQLAQRGPRASRCEHAQAAHALFPNADAARRLAQRCR